MDQVPCMRSTNPLSKGALQLLASTLLLFVASGCSILFPYEPPGCASLSDVCPDLECDAYQVEDGCAICACADPEEPVGCYSDEECGENQRCNASEICLSPPECGDADRVAAEEADPINCPAVCYGFCEDVEDNTSCTSDRDCAPNEFCDFNAEPQPIPPSEPDGPNEEPGEGEGEGEDRLIAQEGTCRPFGECDLAIPDCPPGFRLEFEVGPDGCEFAFCVEDEPRDCSDIFDLDQCLNTRGCQAVFPTDGGGGDGGGGLVPECFERCEGDEACIEECEQTDPAPPEPEFFCIDDEPVEECFSDFDCPPQAQCVDGQCQVDGSICEELDIEECELTEGCRIDILAEPCVCKDPEDPDSCGCTDDGGIEVCVPDFGVPPPPPPFECESNDDCDEGQQCISVERCEECDNEDEPCLPGCITESYCETLEPMCVSSDDCGPNQVCNDGQCEEGNTDVRLCLEDADCPEEFFCAVEAAVCICPEGQTCETCFSECVPGEREQP